jgi:ABC-type polysaccharide/polyol phosphate transport system ATPase subunit
MLLEATQVAIERGDRRLLSDVDLSVSGGEIWQLVGANGVGKTSLLRGLAGVARLGVTGEIRHAGAFLYLGACLRAQIESQPSGQSPVARGQRCHRFSKSDLRGFGCSESGRLRISTGWDRCRRGSSGGWRWRDCC